MMLWEWILSTPNENREFWFHPEVHPPEATMLTWVCDLGGLPPTARIVVGGVKVRLHLLLCIVHNVHICKILLWHMITCLRRSDEISQCSKPERPAGKQPRPPYLYCGILLERYPLHRAPYIHPCAPQTRQPPTGPYSIAPGQ